MIYLLMVIALLSGEAWLVPEGERLVRTIGKRDFPNV